MKDKFEFKTFMIQQDRCAMKVGTDGVLLGAWAQGGAKILDIGTGTGLVSLMMAQRFPQAHIWGVDIDKDACVQAKENVSNSIFSGRVEVLQCSVQSFADSNIWMQMEQTPFDAIVSNPPYFENSLKNQDIKRQIARHTDKLPCSDLFKAVNKLLSKNGVFSVIVPTEELERFLSESCIYGLSLSRKYGVKTTMNKHPRRYLLAFSRQVPSEVDIQTVNMQNIDGTKSEWYANLTDKFYLY